jgi:hypothetical protein
MQFGRLVILEWDCYILCFVPSYYFSSRKGDVDKIGKDGSKQFSF